MLKNSSKEITDYSDKKVS